MDKKKLVVLCLLSGLAVAASAADGASILALSDKKLLPERCSYQLSMVTTDANGKANSNLMDGWKSGMDKNVMIERQPARLAGSVHLRKAGVIWTYYSTNKKVTKIGYQSVFMGSLLNYGDVMASELSVDYDVASMEATDEEYELVLKVKQGHEGYDKIALRIDRKTLLPIRRDYYALSGILLKSSEFKDIVFKDGSLVSMRQEFYESVKDQKTVLEYSKIKLLASIPDKYYNEGYISRFGS